jgi:acetyl esterase/lipase
MRSRRERRALLLFVGLALSMTAAVRAEEARLAEDQIAIASNLSYRDGCKSCVLDLAMPKQPAKKLRPAIVVIHGGGWIEGDKSSFSVFKNRPPGNIIEFARLGFVAVTINYRLSREAPFPAALDDCRTAVRWLRAHASEYQVDPERIGAWGNSAGGHLALLLAMMPKEPLAAGEPYADQSSLVQAAVSDSGPIDMVWQIEHKQLTSVVEKFLGGPLDEKSLATYQRASPSSYVNGKLPPLLLIYGELDGQVDVRTSDELVAALSRAGHRDVSYIRLANVDHCPHSLVRVPYLQGVVEEFFARTLKLKDNGKQ